MRGVWLLCVVYIVHETCALYFPLGPAQHRCFLEEIPEDTLVVFKYVSKDFHPGLRQEDEQTYSETHPGFFLQVEEPESRFSSVSHWLGAKGSIPFTSSSAGEHKFCIYALIPWQGKTDYRFEVHLEVGHAAMDFDQLAKTEHLSLVEVELRKLTVKVMEILKERRYQKKREEEFRNTSESSNARVMWWSIFELALITGLSIAQVHMLQRFFQKKKIL